MVSVLRLVSALFVSLRPFFAVSINLFAMLCMACGVGRGARVGAGVGRRGAGTPSSVGLCGLIKSCGFFLLHA